MTIRKLASLIAFKEGKKSEARIGNIREILKVLVTLEVESQDMETSPLETLAVQVKKQLLAKSKSRKK